ncbi:MAG: outer membrane beta-barrel protein [Sphingomicrobium sp.]
MKTCLLAATAMAAIAVAAPAAARDRSAYVGLELGALFVTDTNVEGNVFTEGRSEFDIDHKMGVDGDLIAGYDFGMFRAEAELGYKRSEHDEYDGVQGPFDADGRSSVYSLMANAMVDLGHDEGFQFYAGAGVGYAQVIHVIEDGSSAFKIKDRGFAWQVIAGVRKSVSQYFDIGLKYRYFDAGNVDDDFGSVSLDSEYKSHSVLFSLIHNFNSPLPPPPPMVEMAPPPPPPPPPATQTCADGSVILATDACPLPPPPPPPPPPEPERG